MPEGKRGKHPAKGSSIQPHQGSEPRKKRGKHRSKRASSVEPQDSVPAWIKTLRVYKEDIPRRPQTNPWIDTVVVGENPDETHPLLHLPPQQAIATNLNFKCFGRPALGSQLDHVLGQPALDDSFTVLCRPKTWEEDLFAREKHCQIQKIDKVGVANHVHAEPGIRFMYQVRRSMVNTTTVRDGKFV
jgi:hypothetical protein